MGFRNTALAAMALLFMSGCGGGRYLKQESESGTPAVYDFSTKSYAENDDKMPRFRDASDLKSYLERGFNAAVPAAVEFYNGKFGEDISAEDAGIEYREFWMFSGGNPVFRYDMDEHRLIMEYAPGSGADRYARRICKNKEALDAYESETFGFVPHETAHWFHDRMLNKYGYRDFSGHVMGENRALDKIKAMIVEGTAVYMAKLLDGDESFRGKDEYGSPIDSLMDGKFLPVWVYPAGEELVTPILDKDFKNGIMLMSENFPEVRTADDVRTYQAGILSRLERLGKSNVR